MARLGALDRRRFLSSLLALPGVVAGGSKRAWSVSPFRLGVASGDVTATEIALWTRLATDPLAPGGGLGPEDVDVGWEIAEDEGLRRIVASGRVAAVPELGHSVHVTARGLEPGRRYWYRFHCGDAHSPIGCTRTLPTGRVGGLRFVTACCQHWEQGTFVAYDAIRRDDPDFVVHLGDYIYEVSRGGVREHAVAAAPTTLEDFRRRHALYRTDPHLQAAHSAVPFFQTLDNHDATASRPQDDAGRALRRAAYQAWFEHTPVRTAPAGFAGLALARGVDVGDLLRLDLLDTRQFRDPESVCSTVDSVEGPPLAFGIVRERCERLEHPSRRMIAAEHERRLINRLSSAPTRWSVLASTVLLAPFAFHHAGEELVYASGWDAYPAQRSRLLEAWRSSDAGRVVVSGDLHSHWAADVPADPRRPDGEAIAAELLTTSISSDWPEPLDRPIRDNLTHNPHVQHYDGTRRGYQLHHVDRERWTASLRTVSPDALASGVPDLAPGRQERVVERGRAGLAD